MAEKEVVETSEAQIAVHWKEEGYYYPSTEFIAQANMSDKGIYDRFSLDNFPNCFKEYADLLTWYEYWDEILDTSDAPCYKWFKGGKINASYNCVDRHLKDNKNKTAIHFVPEPLEEGYQHITYQELYVRVNEFAALLRDFAGLKRGDRVTLHMPMIPELPITMLACARLGVIHSQVFGGFSGTACADRIVDSGSNVLITMDAYYRSGTLLDHKQNADVAVEHAAKDGQKVDKVLVWQRYPGKYSAKTPMVDGRDFFVNDLLKKYYGARVEPERMNAEDPLFLMYTSGTTGKPKGCQHGTGGYLAYVTGTSKFVRIFIPKMSTGAWPTSAGSPATPTSSTARWPTAPRRSFTKASHLSGCRPRSWRIAQDLDVNIFHTAPTAIRALRKIGPDEPAKYNYHFKHMTTVGEPIEPEVWKWYHKEVGKGEAIIVDTWWQTETGGFLCSTLPAITPMKPGSAGPGMPGIHPIIYDDDGNVVPRGAGKAGNICIQNPWPGMFMTIWGDRDRFVDTYFARYCKDPKSTDWRDWPYLTGDAAVEAEDGYYRILGRIDDVINVSGHRLGTKEIESAALVVQEVAEAAVVPVNHEIKGKEPDLYIALKPGSRPVTNWPRRFRCCLRPRSVRLPNRARSGSSRTCPRPVPARSCAACWAPLSNNRDVGDVMTLANPEIVEEIKEMVKK
jgi:acetyl-CoA synthetase